MGQAATAGVAPREEALFLDRVERKFFVPSAHGDRLVREFGERLNAHRFVGPGANRLPRPSHYIASLYFDNAAGDVEAAKLRGDGGAQVRAREYYDEHIDLTELATSAEELVAAAPVLWLEVKQPVDGRVRKFRCGISGESVVRFLRDGQLTERVAQLQAEQNGEDAAEVLQQIADVSRCHTLPLRPACIVHYRRHAWQDDTGSVRVTLDSRLSFFGPPKDAPNLRHGVSGRAVGKWPEYVLEIKTVGEIPGWLDALAQELRLAPASLDGRVFSKFLAASAALRGEFQTA